MSKERFTNLYDLMDAAYDSPSIHQFSLNLGHIPIIDDNPRRGGTKKQLDLLEKRRYNERSSVERVILISRSAMVEKPSELKNTGQFWRTKCLDSLPLPPISSLNSF